MRILLTNDDGLRAEGLIPLIRWCRKLGEVIPVVPKVEQSGKSHSIEIHTPFEAKEVQLAPDITAWSVDSTPADCIRFAVLGLKMEFDLVISGVNRGLNIGRDIMYSGTAGAVFEAGSMKIPAVAISTDPASYPCDEKHLDTVYDFFIKHALMDKHTLYNVNIPKDPHSIRITRQGGPYYSDDFDPQGNDMYLARGKSIYTEGYDYEIDTNAALHGYISISPLTICRTDLGMFDKLKELNK
jgi:5'-nucleotidase